VSAPFERIAIVGLGLLGGSLGLAARRRGLARRVAGAGRSRESLEGALARGAVDEAHLDPLPAVRDAQLVVLATPPGAMPGVVARLAPVLEPGALLSDVGSVKAAVAESLPGLLPPGVCYLGAHPMAGSHRKGIAHARADLFEGAPCVLTPTPDTPPAALERLARFWRELGARVVVRDPQAHDAEVAWVSHLPHLLAFAFARALSAAPAGAGELAGAGFRDFTRIAHSDPELWAEILSANHKALAGPLQELAARLRELQAVLESGDAEAVERFLGEAREALARAVAAAPGAPPDRSPLEAAARGQTRSQGKPV
jgi:prephenate dehydrogenase